jgi:hypothetical protein
MAHSQSLIEHGLSENKDGLGEQGGRRRVSNIAPDALDRETLTIGTHKDGK